MASIFAYGEVPTNSVWTFAKIFQLVDVTGNWDDNRFGEMNTTMKLRSIRAGFIHDYVSSAHMGLRGVNRALVSSRWMSFCHAIISLLWQVLRPGVASLNIPPSTQLEPPLSKVQGLVWRLG